MVAILGNHVTHLGNMILISQLAMITLFGTCTTFNWTDAVNSMGDPTKDKGMVYVAGANPVLYDIPGRLPPILMVLVGFAFFSVNRARSAWNSIAGTLITYSLVLQWGQLCYGFFDLCQTTYFGNTDVSLGHPPNTWQPIPISIGSIYRAGYVALAVLIANSVVMGKASMSQQYGLAFFATVFVTANAKIGEVIQISDAGGANWIFLFGSTFGLAASKFLKGPSPPVLGAESRATAGGVQSLLGLLLIYSLLPSFVSGNIATWARAANSYDPDSPGSVDTAWEAAFAITVMRAQVIVAFALASSVVTSIAASISTFGNRVSLHHVVVGSLAGGIAVAPAVAMISNPYGAMMVGCVVSFVSVKMSNHMSAALARNGIYDASGSFSGMYLPGLFSGVISAIAAGSVSVARNGEYTEHQLLMFVPLARTELTQGGYQMAYTVITATFAIIAGALTGSVLNAKIFAPRHIDTLGDDEDDWCDAEGRFQETPKLVVV